MSYTRLNPKVVEHSFSGTSDASGNLNLGVTVNDGYLVGVECAYRNLPHVYQSIWFATIYTDSLDRVRNTAVSGKCYLIKKS